MRFETTITSAAEKLVYFGVREKFIGSLKPGVANKHLDINLHQADFVEIGKTRSGMRVWTIVTWNGGADGLRVNDRRKQASECQLTKVLKILNINIARM